jgi:hypothetical protein
VNDVRVEASELDPRVDRLFAAAMEQQLEEQRTLTRLAGRMEAALDELQRSLSGLAEHLTAVAVPLPAEVERARVALLGAVARLEHDADVSRGQMLESLERLRGQLDLSKLGGQIADLADRVEQGTAPLPVAIGEMRTTLVGVLEGVERVTEQSRSDLSAWLSAFWNEFEGRLSSGQEDAVRALAAAQCALTEQAGRIETLRETLQLQAGHAADRVAALLDHATANQREALAALAAAATQLTVEASSTRQAVASQSDTLREAITEAVAAAQIGLDRSLATVRTLSEQLTHNSATSRETVERMQEFVEALDARLAQSQVAAARQLSQAAAVLERAAEGIEPSVAGLVDEFRQALFDTAAIGRAQAESSTTTLREAANEAIVELRALVDDACRRIYGAHTSATAELSSAAAGVIRAAEDMQPAFSSALARLYGAVAAAATQVRATSEETAARTDAALAEALRGIESTISDRLAQASAVSQGAATRLAEAQASAVTRLEQAAEMVGERAASLHPALVQAADELRRSLLEAAAEDRLRTEASLSMVQHAAETTLAKVDETVNEALALARGEVDQRLEQADAIAQAAAAGVLATADDAQERLRLWLAGALSDAVAQVTRGLADQLAHAEERVDETANRLETVYGNASGELQVTAEGASTRMTEAARALTAVAGEFVGNTERRLTVLSQQVDTLIERINVVADAEGRRADACEAMLACVSDIGARNGSNLEWPQIDAGAAHELEAMTLRLQDAVERAENVERRVANGADRVADRLEAALAGLGRLEASLVNYLRERDRMAAADRERLLNDLVDQFGAAISRKDHRLLGGLLPTGRRREESPPGPPDPPLNPPRSVRPESVPLESLRPEAKRGQGRIVPAERVEPRREPGTLGDQAYAHPPAAPLPTCDVCGFVGKSAAGVAAHRRTHR